MSEPKSRALPLIVPNPMSYDEFTASSSAALPDAPIFPLGGWYRSFARGDERMVIRRATPLQVSCSSSRPANKSIRRSSAKPTAPSSISATSKSGCGTTAGRWRRRRPLPDLCDPFTSGQATRQTRGSLHGPRFNTVSQEAGCFLQTGNSRRLGCIECPGLGTDFKKSKNVRPQQ